MSSTVDKKQKLMIEFLLADISIFSKALKIMKPDYFDKPLDRVVEFIHEYYNEFKGIPSGDIIEAETGVELIEREIEYDQINYTLSQLEKFCKEAAMSKAILDSVDFVNAGKLDSVYEAVRKALLVKFDDTVGIELFSGAKERIETTEQHVDERGFGIEELDQLLNGVRRKEVGVIYGGTGTGKSIMLGNFAWRFSKQGLHGVVISLELKDFLYAKRLDCIFTGTDIGDHKENADFVQNFYDENQENLGSIVVKFMKTRSNAADIRTFLMEYELTYKRKPDYICIDYLALMGLIEGNMLTMNKFDSDEIKIFDLQSIAEDYDSYVFTAGQLNRDGSDVIDLGPKHVAGGLSAVNGSDWSLGMVASDEDLDNNQFQIKQLKIRNGARTKKPIIMYKCPRSLRVSDKPFIGQSPVIQKRKSFSVDKKEVPVDGKPKLTSKEKLKAALKRDK